MSLRRSVLPPTEFVEPALLFASAFLLWLLNASYEGIWHDARVYGLLAAHWLYPNELANDLFFRFGSQGDFSVFTPIYGTLVGLLGLDRAAWWVVLTGGVLWVASIMALSLALLGNTLEGRFAILFGTILSLNYSPNMGTFTLNEGFATARSWAIPAGLLAVALLRANRLRGALVLATFSATLHPLLGIWPLALVMSSGLRLRTVGTVATVVVAVVVVIGMMNLSVPYFRLIDGDLWAFVTAAADIVFKPPASSRLPAYFGSLGCLLLGARFGCFAVRPIYARLFLVAGTGLVLAVVGSYWFPVEIVVQVQAWRVFWLVIPLGGFAALEFARVIWRSSPSGSGPLYVVIFAALALVDIAWFGLLVWLACVASFIPGVNFSRLDLAVSKWHRSLVAIATMLWLLAIPGLLLELSSAGNRFVNPLLDLPEWANGLLTGATWPLPLLLAWLLGWRTLRQRATGVLVLVICLCALLIDHWDRRPEFSRQAESRFLTGTVVTHPFGAHVRPGEMIYWPDQEMIVWFELHTASYYGAIQGTGAVFSRAKFDEWSRRGGRLVQGRMDPQYLCADPILDWIVWHEAVPGLLAHATSGGSYLYACANQRAVSPEPTFVGATLK